LYRSPKSRRLRWTGHVARMEEDRSSFKISTGKPTTCYMMIRISSGVIKKDDINRLD